MHPKRGQITTFIIIGVVLVALVGIFLYTRSVSIEKEEAVPADIAPIKIYVEQCLKQTAEDAVLTVALQGGYYFAPENSINVVGIKIPYYLYNGNVSIPTKEMIESELSLYLMFNLPLCADMTSFIEKGYNITADIPSIKTTIGEKNVFFDVNIPINIQFENQEQTISRFNANINAGLMKLYNASLEYIEEEKKDTSLLLLSEPVDISSEKGLTFEAFTFEDKTIIFSFIDNNTMIKNQPLIYAFAMKLMQTNEEVNLGYPAENLNENQI